MAYHVSVTKDGYFRAAKSGESFECKYWGVFARELECRLLIETRKKLRETAPIEKKSKSDAEIF